MNPPRARDGEPDDPPSPQATDRADRGWRRGLRLDLLGIAIVCIVILVGYFEVPFEGRTFSTASQVAGVHGCGTPTGQCLHVTSNDPRVDPEASSVALEPWDQVTHRLLSQDQLPLWNPYQGIGMPLAANMQSAVFDPMLLPLHLHPTPLVADLTALVGLLLMGCGAYVAARVLGLGPMAAIMSGSVYGLSGWFFSYSNNQWFRIFLFLPLILACIERSIRTNHRLPVALLSVSIGAMVLVGMPEPMFIILVTAGIFSAVRLFVGDSAQTRPRTAARLLFGAGVGLAFAAPQLVLFHEYLPLSINAHANLGNAPPITDPVGVFLNWMMPKINAPSRGTINPTSGGTFSKYAFSRNWVGVGAVLLAGTAVLHPRALRRYAGWPLLAAGGVAAIQIYGGRLVAWTRFIPIYSQVNWSTFGTPVIALVAALLAGIGLQTLFDGKLVKARFAAVVAVVALLAIIIVIGIKRPVALGHDVSVLGGWPLGVLTAATVAAAIFVLAPRAATVLILFVVILEVVAVAPRGIYAPRQNPYPSESWTDFVHNNTKDGARILSPNGVLYPDTSSVYGLYDPRMLDALYVDRYWRYIKTFISVRIGDRWTAVGALESAPAVAGNSMFDLLGIRYVLYYATCDRAADFACVSSTAPPVSSQFQVVYQAGGVVVYENTDAAPRVFVVHDVHTVPNETAAIDYLKAGEPARFSNGVVDIERKNPRDMAVIEGQHDAVPRAQPCATNTDSARVVSYKANKVTVNVSASCAGLLVLSDEYYPGWTATVNGHTSSIYATDVALRGVSVPAGRSTVVFRYQPSSFKLGVVFLMLGILALVGLGATALWPFRRSGATWANLLTLRRARSS
jgi:hypothetical protein